MVRSRAKQGRITLAVAGLIACLLVAPATAGHKLLTQKYDVVTGYVLQPQAQAAPTVTIPIVIQVTQTPPGKDTPSGQSAPSGQAAQSPPAAPAPSFQAPVPVAAVPQVPMTMQMVPAVAAAPVQAFALPMATMPTQAAAPAAQPLAFQMLPAAPAAAMTPTFQPVAAPAMQMVPMAMVPAQAYQVQTVSVPMAPAPAVMAATPVQFLLPHHRWCWPFGR